MIQNSRGIIYGDRDDPFVSEAVMDLIANEYTVRSDMMRTGLDSRKDLNKECDYPETANITINNYKDMYDRNPIAARVVEVLPEESWQVAPQIFEEDDSETLTPFEEAWKQLGKSMRGEESWYGGEDGHPIWEYLSQADKLSGIGHYGIILLGLDDGKPLDQPVDGFQDPAPDSVKVGPIFVNNKKRKQSKLLYISVFDESYLQLGGVEYEANRYSPRYRKPKYYSINMGGETSIDSGASTINRDSPSVRVHWSRIVHVADNRGSSEIVGAPRQRAVWDRLLDLRKVYGGDAEGFWKNCTMKLFLETHPQLGGDVNVDAEALRQGVWDMDNGLQKSMLLKGMAAKTVAPAVVDPTAHITVQIDAICIKISVPKRIFMGSERGELASGQDDSTWNDRIRARRTKYLTPRVIIPFIDRLIQVGVLPEPGESGYKVDWPDPETMKPGEKADVAVKNTTALTTYIAGQGETMIDPLDFLTRFLDMDETEAEEILDRAQEHAEEKAEEAATAAADAMQAGQPIPGQPGQDPAMSGGPGQPDQVPGAPGQPPKPGQPPGSPSTGPAGAPPSPAGSPAAPGMAAPVARMPPLNGAQITAAKDILLSVSAGGTPPDVAEVLLQSLGIPPEMAARMAGSAGKHSVPTEKADKLQADQADAGVVKKTPLGNEEVENVFCPTGPGGGVDPKCSPGGAGKGGFGIDGEPKTAPPPGDSLRPNVEKDSNQDGVTDTARVGVPGHVVPPPPQVPQLPNLTPHEREVEENFRKAFHDNPDKMASDFLNVVKATTKLGEPPTFGTDDAKVLTNAWGAEGMSLEERSQNRATLNLALHQTANAVTKRAFVQHLDTLKPGDEIMVTVGGCGAGKGYALKNVPEALAVKQKSKAVWDSAGDQNATENPWIQSEAQRRGLKVNYVYVHADPHTQWADPKKGVVSRAQDPKDGRMVDAFVFADSYAIGAKNHQAFFESNKNNPQAAFVFLDNTGVPKLTDSVPASALNLDRKSLADYAVKVIEDGDAIPAHVKRGATIGLRVWGKP